MTPKMTDDRLQRVIEKISVARKILMENGTPVNQFQLQQWHDELAALSAQTEARDGEYEVWQDGMMVAGASGEGALQEAKHYAMVYGHQSAPVTIYKVIRKEIAQGDL